MVFTDNFGNLSLQDEFLSEVMSFEDVNEKKYRNSTTTESKGFNTKSGVGVYIQGNNPTTTSSNDDTTFGQSGQGAIGTETFTFPTTSSTILSSQCFPQSSLTSFGTSSTEGTESEISSPTQDDIFSPSSSISSSSSVSDTSYTRQGCQDSFFASHSNAQIHSRIDAGDKSRVDYNTAITCQPNGPRSDPKEGVQRSHPRRTAVSASWTQPRLVRQEHRRHQLVENLVDSATHLVSLIWPEFGSKDSFHGKVMSLRHFIRETLRRSRTSYSTLQVTLWYLVLLRPCVREFCHKPKGDAEQTWQSAQQANDSNNFRAMRCGRRMFLAALILASKYLQDRNYTARAWSKITGLRTQEIVENEFNFLAAIGWKLHLKEQDFAPWNHIILRCTESTWLGRNIRTTWSKILGMLESKSSLQQICSFLDLRRTCPLPPTGGCASLYPEAPRSNDCFKVPPRPSNIPGLQVESSEKPEKEPYLSEPNVWPGPPAQPTLGGKLATPQLTPKAASSSLSTPAVGGSASACNFGPPSETTSFEMDDACRNLAWDKALSEFPMELVKTPEPISSGEDGSRQGGFLLATRNKAFGLITPSSSFHSDSSDRDDTASNEITPRPNFQSDTVGPDMSACETPEKTSDGRVPSSEFRQASRWIDMLAQAAETVDSRGGLEEGTPTPKASLLRPSNTRKAPSTSSHNPLDPIRTPSRSEGQVDLDGLQHCERATFVQPFAKASLEDNIGSGRTPTTDGPPRFLGGPSLSPSGNENLLRPRRCHRQEWPERMTESSPCLNQVVGLSDRKRSRPDSSCRLPNAKARCCGPSLY